jgi:hypothetical protein
MSFPAFDEASRDPSLRGTPWAVYRHLVDELDTREFTDSKRLAMCSALGDREDGGARTRWTCSSREAIWSGTG